MACRKEATVRTGYKEEELHGTLIISGTDFLSMAFLLF